MRLRAAAGLTGLLLALSACGGDPAADGAPAEPVTITTMTVQQ